MVQVGCLTYSGVQPSSRIPMDINSSSARGGAALPVCQVVNTHAQGPRGEASSFQQGSRGASSAKQATACCNVWYWTRPRIPVARLSLVQLDLSSPPSHISAQAWYLTQMRMRSSNLRDELRQGPLAPPRHAGTAGHESVVVERRTSFNWSSSLMEINRIGRMKAIEQHRVPPRPGVIHLIAPMCSNVSIRIR